VRSPVNNRRWPLVIATIGVACVILIWKVRRPPSHVSQSADSPLPPASGLRQPHDPGTEARTSAPALAARRLPAVVSSTAETTFGYPNPVIESVVLDKSEVCRGEENFIHVNVRTVNGTDADNRILLGGVGFIGSDSTGPRMPIRLTSPLAQDAWPTVIVQGWGGTSTEQRIPPVAVKDCDSGPIVMIQPHRVLGAGADVYDLEIKLIPDVELSLVDWDFGDGQKRTSGPRAVQHDYSARPQLSRFSDFVVSVVTRSRAGRTLRGSRTIEIFNREYWKRRTQRNTIAAGGTPTP